MNYKMRMDSPEQAIHTMNMLTANSMQSKPSWFSLTFFAFFILFSVMTTTSAFAQAITSNGYQYSIAPQASWVNDNSLPDSVSGSQEAVSYLLLDNQLNLANQQHARFTRVAQKVNSEQGLKEVAELFLYFNPDYQTLTIHHINLIRDGKTSDVVSKARISLAQQENELNMGLITGEVTAIILLPDVRVGDLIDYSFTVDGVNSVYGDKAFASFSTRWSVDLAKSVVRVITDIDKPLRYRTFNTEQTITVNQTSNIIEYQLTQLDLKGIDDEGEYPNWYNPYGYVEFSQYQSWQEVNDWALALFTPEQALDAELIAQNQQWRDQAQSDKAYIQSVVEFVQNNVRYLGLELGQNSHRPNHPNLVFERRYGDCKDKAYMIALLLRQQGINAYPALVSSATHSAIAERLPSPGLFDHVISKIDLADQEYWIDGTRTHQFGDLDKLGVGDFQKALVVRKGQTSLSDVVDPSEHPLARNIDEVLTAKSYSDAVEVSLSLTFQGAEAEDMRAYLANDGLDSYTKDVVNFYRRTYPTIRAKHDMKSDDNKQTNQLTVSGKFEIPEYFDSTEEKHTITLYGENVKGMITLPNVIERKMPLALYNGFSATHRITFNLPEEINWDLSEAPYVLENPNIYYQRDVQSSPSKVTVTHLYRTKRDYVPVKEVDSHVQTLRDINEALYYSVWVTNQDASKKNDLRSRLRSALKSRLSN